MMTCTRTDNCKCVGGYGFPGFDGKCHSIESCQWKKKIINNADRIRSMSDEELATEITKNPSIPCRMCEYYNHKLGHCDARRDFVCVTAYAEALALGWLKQPAKEE